MKQIKHKKIAYLIVILIMIVLFIVYYFLNYHFLLSDEFKNTPRVICILGAVAIFCIKRSGNDQ